MSWIVQVSVVLLCWVLVLTSDEAETGELHSPRPDLYAAEHEQYTPQHEQYTPQHEQYASEHDIEDFSPEQEKDLEELSRFIADETFSFTLAPEQEIVYSLAQPGNAQRFSGLVYVELSMMAQSLWVQVGYGAKVIREGVGRKVTVFVEPSTSTNDDIYIWLKSIGTEEFRVHIAYGLKPAETQGGAATQIADRLTLIKDTLKNAHNKVTVQTMFTRIVTDSATADAKQQQQILARIRSSAMVESVLVFLSSAGALYLLRSQFRLGYQQII